MKETSGLGLGTRVAIASILIPCGIAVLCIGIETLYPPQHALQISYLAHGSLGPALPVR
jgi:hypothetical protein